MFFKEILCVVLIAAFVAGSPLGNRIPRISFIDGVPFVYSANSGDSVIPLTDQLPELATPPSSSSEDNSPIEADEGPLPRSNEQKRSALRFAIARRSHEVKEKGPVLAAAVKEDTSRKLEKYTPAISVGAMMNIRDFFDGLKGNVDLLNGVSPDEFKALSSLSLPVESFRSVSQYVEDSQHIRPTANAAYLHAIRMYRPSNRVRALVDHHPEQYRGANNFNPSYLWTGLG